MAFYDKLSAMTIGIILAAGKGTRIQSTDRNKTSLEVGGKPLVTYGVEVLAKTMDKTVVVVGAFSESVKAALVGFEVIFAEQTEQKGTGHAVQVAMQKISESNLQPVTVCVGYGDHMMFYTPELVNQLLDLHKNSHSAITMLSTHHDSPSELAWGRVIRGSDGSVEKIVEQKDATEDELAITELNAGFYCFDADFLAAEVKKLQPNAITQELYLTDLIGAATEKGLRISALAVPFEFVGMGINTKDQLAQVVEQLAV